MTAVSTYLNFARETEAAFAFYKSVFGTEFEGDIMRYGNMPEQEGQPPVAPEDRNLILHVSLPILGGHSLMGSDVPESMGSKIRHGNAFSIMLHPESRAEADRLFNALSEGGEIEMPMEDVFWGDYFGSFTDRFGVKWMIDHSNG
ncbi:MAG: VOC family protein [Spirochaetaceae bacterium]|nr:MAG: VOC family protein [Spirochaetaceae bacterium]